MTEPRRLLDEDPDRPGASLLRAAKAYRPNAEAHQKILVGVGLAAGATTATTAGKAAGVLATLKVLAASKAGIAVLALAGGAAVAGAAYEVGTRATATAPRATGLVMPSPPSREAKVASLAPPTPVPEVPTVAEPAAIRAPADSASPSTKLARPEPRRTSPLAEPTPEPKPDAVLVPPSTEDADTLAEELTSLDAVRAAQRSSQFGVALARLDEHERRFPHGHLSQQVELTRIEVLVASGDRAQAKRNVDRFLATHPRSVLAPRAREIRDSLEPR